MQEVKKQIDDLLEDKPDQKEVFASLEMVAMVLNVEKPPAMALSVYVKILGDYPSKHLKEGVEELLKSYKYNSFPKPADFVEAIEKKTDYWEMRHTVMLIRSHQRKMMHSPAYKELGYSDKHKEKMSKKYQEMMQEKFGK